MLHILTLFIYLGKANTYYWIGAIQRPNAKGPIRFLNGKPVPRQLWHAGEPNQINGRDRQCVDLGVPQQQFKMNDYPCKARLNYMCEKSKFKVVHK